MHIYVFQVTHLKHPVFLGITDFVSLFPNPICDTGQRGMGPSVPLLWVENCYFLPNINNSTVPVVLPNSILFLQETNLRHLPFSISRGKESLTTINNLHIRAQCSCSFLRSYSSWVGLSLVTLTDLSANYFCNAILIPFKEKPCLIVPKNKNSSSEVFYQKSFTSMPACHYPVHSIVLQMVKCFAMYPACGWP